MILASIWSNVQFADRRVTPSGNTKYVGAYPKGKFVSGRVQDSVLFYEILHCVQIFCEKRRFFHPAGDDIRYQIRDRLMPGSIGRFAGSLISWCLWSRCPPRNSCQ
jgi:hypothetical protein